jgi:hypothetical protein
VTEIDRTIDGVARTIAEVLEKKKYSIDYYQREYKGGFTRSSQHHVVKLPWTVVRPGPRRGFSSRVSFGVGR